jgi:small subunit ribosomal protein S8
MKKMTRIDPLTDALTAIRNSENTLKKKCTIKPASKLLGETLRVMQENNYINQYEYIQDGREGLYKINLAGKINTCKTIKPRYAVKKDDYEKYEKRYLPAKDIGILLVSTPKGLLTHKQAKKSKTGGRLIAYIY